MCIDKRVPELAQPYSERSLSPSPSTPANQGLHRNTPGHFEAVDCGETPVSDRLALIYRTDRTDDERQEVRRASAPELSVRLYARTRFV